ncbi:hypothetical protein [Solemya velum gill symbiont]|uniref:Uncharacterized protein n=1 Tax=Solemya velum gill symbiont TaxID=2340 RepID=A0A0B0HF99_SOVGS|nr:hypothetical protein [Solemya velum gill symbiont]KHF26614.1 hypothetical protein JV46_12260 [Solemya velum gill symbiont]
MTAAHIELLYPDGETPPSTSEGEAPGLAHQNKKPVAFLVDHILFERSKYSLLLD